MKCTEAYVFYINCNNEYYKASVLSDDKDKVQTYLESISKEVRYKGTEAPKEGKYGTKKIPCGELLQFTYHGNIPPKGLEIDRRYHTL